MGRHRRRLLRPLEIGSRASEARSGQRRRTRILEVEDLLLAAWVAGLDYLVRWAMRTPEALLAQVDALAHWAVLLLGSAWLFLIFTRSPDDDDRERALMRRILMVGPAFPVLSIYAYIASGLQERWHGPQPRSADGEPPWPAPTVRPLWRRTAALPVMILGDAIFTGTFAATPVGRSVEMTAEHAFFLVALGAIYVFTVAGPRIVAGATLSPLVWIARFVFFLAAAWFGLHEPAATP